MNSAQEQPDSVLHLCLTVFDFIFLYYVFVMRQNTTRNSMYLKTYLSTNRILILMIALPRQHVQKAVCPFLRLKRERYTLTVINLPFNAISKQWDRPVISVAAGFEMMLSKPLRQVEETGETVHFVAC